MADGYQTNENRLFNALAELEKINSTDEVPSYLEELARVYSTQLSADNCRTLAGRATFVVRSPTADGCWWEMPQRKCLGSKGPRGTRRGKMGLGSADHNERLFDILAAIDAIAATEVIPIFLQRVVQAYNLKTAAFLGIGFGGRRDAEPLVCVTYSFDWVSRYRARQYQNIDPAIQIGMRRLLPMDWGEFKLRTPEVRTLFGEASEFGLGKNGLTVPVHGRAGERALFSVTSDISRGDWRQLRQIYMRDFQVLAAHLNSLVTRLEGADLFKTALSKRERECLEWVAEGKTGWEISVILGLSERTVRSYLESARYKLGASSNAQAATKALSAGLLGKRL